MNKFKNVVAGVSFTVLILEAGALAGGLEFVLELAEDLCVNLVLANGDLLRIAEGLAHPLLLVAAGSLLFHDGLLHMFELLAVLHEEIVNQVSNFVVGGFSLHVFAVDAVKAVVLFRVIGINQSLKEFT